MTKDRTNEQKQPDYFSVQVSEARRFFMDAPGAAPAGLTIVSAGCEHCNRDYSISRKTFPYLSFEYVARGSGTLIL